ncbi:bacillithiol biosynthesis cysteine-adding enzyme BshC [Lunatibacter salilacus]|uniref:bacillithiol biosynthesis cysteine-adding enzyme BshC n=1 Tax=Lunatibacter salilacus TaxID=2483804 RepID=UPI00131C1861|nr:bacillithiol biosynthesis cysteine-adding enzyme BshC [Lunatibacter salilacus]
MKKSTVEPACTGLFSPLFLDYLDQKEATASLYTVYPSLENFRQLLDRRKFDSKNRAVLVDVLAEQYRGLESREAVNENIELLAKENTFTVTTGHQLNLMTGPLYFIYKIVSTINLANKLRHEYPDRNIVPVYWMASEDHDFEEINHFVFDGKKYTWETDQKGAVGEFELDKNLQDLLAKMPFVPDFFTDAYRDSANLAEAVRKYVHYLFGEEGLVVVDANNPLLKALFAPIIKDDLLHQRANTLVQEQNNKLEKLGYKPQIFPREINFFYLTKGLRERIVYQEGSYHVMNTDITWTEEELMEELNHFPGRFSPNVVMRPLYQEFILPNVAYLGGPAEVVYWFQLTLIFDHYEVDYPAVMPRNFVVIVPKVLHRKVKKLELAAADIFKPIDQLRITYTLDHAEADLSLDEERKVWENLLDQIASKATKRDPTIGSSANASKVRGLKILDQLARKLRKAEEIKHSTAIRQLRDIKEGLFPGGVPQERKLNFLNFYLENPNFIQELLRQLDPLDFNVVVLEADEN